ncbi:hypothetical protein VTK26DRAFT_6769 [Humicola hyalothermophila]
MSVEANELLDAFKAAALSVTKLYKTSAAAQAKSRAEGYQECLEDILAFLDRENIGLQDGEALRVRKWVTERIDGRDMASPPLESEDETEKPEPPTSSPQLHHSIQTPTQRPNDRPEDQMRDSSAPPVLTSVPCPSSPVVEELDVVVPSQETFTFQSSHPYPHEEAMRLANLDLSDSQTIGSSNNRTTPRNGRNRIPRPGPRTSLGKGAGQKRKVNLAEIFDLGSLGNGKDVFGNWGKRSRLS